MRVPDDLGYLYINSCQSLMECFSLECLFLSSLGLPYSWAKQTPAARRSSQAKKSKGWPLECFLKWKDTGICTGQEQHMLQFCYIPSLQYLMCTLNWEFLIGRDSISFIFIPPEFNTLTGPILSTQ